MAHNVDTSLLRAFVAVAETGGMTRAGQALNLTQAAVSQQIRSLEVRLGFPLRLCTSVWGDALDEDQIDVDVRYGDGRWDATEIT